MTAKIQPANKCAEDIRNRVKAVRLLVTNLTDVVELGVVVVEHQSDLQRESHVRCLLHLQWLHVATCLLTHVNNTYSLQSLL